MRAQVTVYEDAPITSIALSPDGRHLLANLSSHIIHLWALQPFLDRLAAQAANPTGALTQTLTTISSLPFFGLPPEHPCTASTCGRCSPSWTAWLHRPQTPPVRSLKP